MSFFFNRGRNRTNAAELARQTYDLLARLDVANNPNPKVGERMCEHSGVAIYEAHTNYSLLPSRLTRCCRNASAR